MFEKQVCLNLAFEKPHLATRDDFKCFFLKGLPDMNPEMFRQHWCKQIDLGILYYGEKEFKYCSILSKIPPDAAYIAK